MTQPDLFASTYPNHPGAANVDTSIGAADAVAGKAPRLRQDVLDVLADFGPRTTHEVAQILDAEVPSIQPRLSELKRMGKIIDTGDRRFNKSGRPAAVFAVKD